MNMDLWTCILLGCIVSPTDPIAATGILNKLGMSKNVTSVIECESLFNDGTGVALFLFVKGILSQQKGGNFFYIMGKEIIIPNGNSSIQPGDTVVVVTDVNNVLNELDDIFIIS